MTTNKAPEVNLRNIVLNMLLENNKGRLSHLIVKDTLEEKTNPVDKLQEDLKKAIKEERYEDAAKIRDEIKKISK